MKQSDSTWETMIVPGHVYSWTVTDGYDWAMLPWCVLGPGDVPIAQCWTPEDARHISDSLNAREVMVAALKEIGQQERQALDILCYARGEQRWRDVQDHYERLRPRRSARRETAKKQRSIAQP